MGGFTLERIRKRVQINEGGELFEDREQNNRRGGVKLWWWFDCVLLSMMKKHDDAVDDNVTIIKVTIQNDSSMFIMIWVCVRNTDRSKSIKFLSL